MTLQVVNDNRLVDGLVVYLSEADDWSEKIEDALVAATEIEAEGLLATAERAAIGAPCVIQPYLIDIVVDGDVLKPLRYRERLRALGPSVRRDLGKQAEG